MAQNDGILLLSNQATGIPDAPVPFLDGVQISVDGSAAEAHSAVIDADYARSVRITADGDCDVLIAVDATATAQTCPNLLARQPLDVGVPKGARVSVIGAKIAVQKYL